MDEIGEREKGGAIGEGEKEDGGRKKRTPTTTTTMGKTAPFIPPVEEAPGSSRLRKKWPVADFLNLRTSRAI